jgi:hypothetical protein
MKKTNIYKVLLTFLTCVILSSCQKEKEEIPTVEPKPTPVVAIRIKQFPNLVADSATWLKAKNEIEKSEQVAALFNTKIKQNYPAASVTAKYAVAQLDANNESAAKNNANQIYILAIYWFFADKSTNEAQTALAKATELIAHWASVNTSTDHTPRETALLPIYEAYSVIRYSISKENRNKIDTWVNNRANFYKNLKLTGNLEKNNWSTIKLNFLAYYSLILNDQPLFDYTVSFYKQLIELNLMAEGKSEDLINRDAFAYHAYNMLFYARFFKAALLMKDRNYATGLYQFQSPNGASAKKSVDYWEPFLIDPETNVHLEFVNTQYEPDKSRGDYNKPYNPAGTLYVLDELVFIEDRCISYLTDISPTQTRENRNFQFWINSIR